MSPLTDRCNLRATNEQCHRRVGQCGGYSFCGVTPQMYKFPKTYLWLALRTGGPRTLIGSSNEFADMPLRSRAISPADLLLWQFVCGHWDLIAMKLQVLVTRGSAVIAAAFATHTSAALRTAPRGHMCCYSNERPRLLML